MCSIFASFDNNILVELGKQNYYRGQKRHSITEIDKHYNLKQIIKYDYSFNEKNLLKTNNFQICHIQSPTNSLNNNNHPAQLNNMLLWHNGLIKHTDCDRLNKKQNNCIIWDTMLLLYEIKNKQWQNLSEINGSFACLFFIDQKLYIFRNILAPFFIGLKSISSIKTIHTPNKIPHNQIMSIKFHSNNNITLINENISFQTKENPYFNLNS